jgi:hypothetical protein
MPSCHLACCTQRKQVDDFHPDESGVLLAISNHCQRVLPVQIELAPRPDYVSAVQSKITSHMRAVLVDWLIEVCRQALNFP